MTTTEGNKLIAEFMGAYIAKEGQLAYDMDDKYPNGLDRLMPENMKYHTSWDWLMPVVQKCMDVDHYQAYTHYKPIAAMLGTLDILNVHAAVVEFIQWYNNK